jgi:MinD-like ATPase involved in chromosome partitioning or flagellar assembly
VNPVPLVPKAYIPFRWGINARDHVKDRGLARTVRPNKAQKLALEKIAGKTAHRPEPSEHYGEIVYF